MTCYRASDPLCIPVTFKNAIDWRSRPAADIPRVFGGRPVALMGATLAAIAPELT